MVELALAYLIGFGVVLTLSLKHRHERGVKSFLECLLMACVWPLVLVLVLIVVLVELTWEALSGGRH